MNKTQGDMPNDADLIDAMPGWKMNAAEIEKFLRFNPKILYCFDKSR